jgi:SpoIIAA-like
MPITFSIDMRASLIRTIGAGDVTPAEVDDHFTELSKVWPRGAKLDVLLDLSGCTSLPEILQLRAVVSRIQMFGGRKRFGVCAIVATRELLYGLLRVFELLASHRFVAVRVFRNESAAMVWLRERSSAIKQKAS